jgi:hypothetical protein
MKVTNTKKVNFGVGLVFCAAVLCMVIFVLPTVIAQEAGSSDNSQGSSQTQSGTKDVTDPSPPAGSASADNPAADPNQPSQASLSDEENGDSMLPDQSDLTELYKLFGCLFNDQLVSETGYVDYATLRRKRSDLISISRLLDDLHPLVLMSLSNEERIAFWINTYNTCTLRLIIDHYPIQPKWYMIRYPNNSIMQIPGAWDKFFFRIQGLEYNLREIRNLMLLDRHKDPRICFALTDAARGGAMLRNEPILPEKIDEQLNDQVKRFLASSHGLRMDTQNNIIHLSNVFVMNKNVFLASEYAEILKFRTRKPEERAWLNFLFKHLPSQDAAWLESSDAAIRFINFDWALNEQ